MVTHTRTTLTAIGATLFAGALHTRLVRPRVLHWGARPQEISAALPGDDILVNAALQTTRAISIAAPPEAIWPWIIQMGPGERAGVYTYDWIERRLGIDIRNSDRLLPEFQHLSPGDMLGLNEKGQGLRVRLVDAPHALVVQWVSGDSTWAWVIVPDGGGSRLISRNRLPNSGLLFRPTMLFMEPGSLVMERKMLLGIKQRAERHRDEALNLYERTAREPVPASG